MARATMQGNGLLQVLVDVVCHGQAPEIDGVTPRGVLGLQYSPLPATHWRIVFQLCKHVISICFIYLYIFET